MEWDSERVAWLPEEAQHLLRFACTRMVRSYKPVLTGILLDRLPDMEFPLRPVQDEFAEFYLRREEQGLPVERRGAFFGHGGQVDTHAAALTAEKIVRFVFQVHGYARLSAGTVTLGGEAAWLGLAHPSGLWLARECLSQALADFYQRIEALGEAIYGKRRSSDAADADKMVFLLPDTDDTDDLFILPEAD